MSKRKTLGQHHIEAKSEEAPHGAHWLQATHIDEEDYLQELWECISKSKKVWPGVLFIKVSHISDKLLDTVENMAYEARITCPPPFYAQSAWRYDQKTDNLQYLWTVPDRQTCEIILAKPQEWHRRIPALVDQTFRFASGELKELCRTMNKELERPCECPDVFTKGHLHDRQSDTE